MASMTSQDRHRKQLALTLSAKTRRALEDRSRRTGLPISRIVDALVTRLHTIQDAELVTDAMLVKRG